MKAEVLARFAEGRHLWDRPARGLEDFDFVLKFARRPAAAGALYVALAACAKADGACSLAHARRSLRGHEALVPPADVPSLVAELLDLGVLVSAGERRRKLYVHPEVASAVHSGGGKPPVQRPQDGG